ncbi:Uncharacterized protein FWK35_00013748 [Aphis craccivora]|uniref:Uncharacterized protein n=1 Tax=Aphis craccivora TaxID=307492 RepID=A0A6G0YBU4_APHCR|nr:Uncharacterized protein FWK35_00013748 [Aphis craccivora]
MLRLPWFLVTHGNGKYLPWHTELKNSERSDECIDFTMIITSRNNAPISNFGGGFRCKSEYPWLEFAKICNIGRKYCKISPAFEIFYFINIDKNDLAESKILENLIQNHDLIFEQMSVLVGTYGEVLAARVPESCFSKL